MEKTHDEEMAIDLWELISALKKRALIILAACLLGGVVKVKTYFDTKCTPHG